MKKILCGLLIFCLIITTGCDFEFITAKSEPVNKSMDSESSIINPTSAPNINDSTAQNKNITEGDKDISFSTQIIKDNRQDEQAVIITSDTDNVNSSEKINDELVPPVILGGIPMDKWDDDGYIPVIFYYKNKDSMLVPVTRRAIKQSSMANAVLSLMIDDSYLREDLAQYNLYPVLPKNTRVIGVKLVSGVLEINFNKEVLNYKTYEDEKVIVTSLVYTLTQIQGITGIRLLFGGEKLDKLSFGTLVSGVLFRGNTLINANKVNLEKGMEKTDVFLFRNSEESIAYAIPVSFEHNILNSVERFTNIIDLLSNAGTSGNATLLPEGTKLISSSVDKSTLVLNFSEDLNRYGGTTREAAIIRQLLYTFSQFKGVESIKILVNGKGMALPEGTDISSPLQIPKLFNVMIN